MLESSFIYFIARTLPESIILMLSGYLLLGIEIKGKLFNIARQGLILGVFIYLIRTLPINFGIHTILSMILQGTMLYVIVHQRNNIFQLVVATCQVWLSLILSETIYIAIAINVFSLTMEDLTNNKYLVSAIYTLPSLIILILIVFLFRHFNRKTILRGRVKCQ